MMATNTVPETLSSKRLELRPFIMADFNHYAAMLADPEVMRFIGSGRTISRDQAWLNLAQLLGHWGLTGFGLYAVALKSGEFVGRVGLYSPEGWPGLELGWCIRRPFWGQGIALEAARLVKSTAFHCFPDDQLISLIHHDNQRSVALAERLGGYRGGTLGILEKEVLVYHYGNKNMPGT